MSVSTLRPGSLRRCRPPPRLPFASVSEQCP